MSFISLVFLITIAWSVQKLRLCHPETGEAFKMDASLLSLLSHAEHSLHNGGNVILEYLDNDSSGLDDVTAYIPSVWYRSIQNSFIIKQVLVV